jgi:flagellar motor switch protein FliM
MNTKSRTNPPSPDQVLDPRLLGRPVHLLPLFSARLQDDLDELFRAGMNRRYRASFKVGEVTMECAREAAHAGRWLRFSSEVGTLGFALERSVLLAALHYRYGNRDSTAPAATMTQSPVRETATEERLATMLGLQLVTALASRIDAALGAPAPEHGFGPALAGPPPAANVWTVRVPVAEATLGIEGVVWFTLDDAWMSRLLQHLVAPREKAKKAPGGEAGRPLAARLQLTMTGRLLQRELPLGTLLDLRIGEVLPISGAGPTVVLVDDVHLFHAVVAERAGKLCLTSFEDVN